MGAAKLGIPSLRADMLSDIVPETTWHRYGRFDAAKTFFLFRAGRFDHRGIGGTLGFYCDDFRLEGVWTRRAAWTADFVRQAWAGLVCPDFSLWRDAPYPEQLWNVYRSRVLALAWQDAGLRIAPNLSFGAPQSYKFCFQGIPCGAPVVFCQARTVRVADRKLFLRGLRAGVRALEPQRIVFYGQAKWLSDEELPIGPVYSRLPAAIDGMRKVGFGRGAADTWAETAGRAQVAAAEQHGR